MMDKELRKAVNKLDMRELKNLIKYAEQRQEKINEKQKKYLLSRFHDLASEQGLSVDDVVNLKTNANLTATGKPRRKYEPKYANPNNPEQTWTGQGQTPVWLRNEIAKGKKKEDFLI